ncbi:MAG: hypothetical protein RL653_4309 [Pseudomonadota bacterium]|jgi:hypothetical protein
MRAVVVFVALSALAALASNEGLAIVPVGTHHGEEFRAVEPLGSRWCELHGDLFRRVKVEARPVRDELVEGAGGSRVKTGRELRVVAPLGSTARFLVRGLAPRRITAVVTLPESPTLLGNGRPVTLGGAQLIVQSAAGTHRLLYSVNGRTQQLYTQEGGALETWALHWAGDLDGDGRLDLVLTADESANVTTWRLWLSTRAESGELVHEVASYSQSGC